jgi:hypothetical protein
VTASEPVPERPDGGAVARTRRLQPGQVAAIWGVVATAWAVFVLPGFFGPVGFLLGAYAWWRGERRGRWIMVAAVLATILGIAIGFLPDWFVMN